MEQYKSLRKEYNLEKEVPLSSLECEKIKNAFAVDDERSERSTSGHAFYFQFWAHQWTDSVFKPNETLPFNRYDFNDNGQGVYPLRGLNSSLIDHKTGKFLLKDGGLPILVSDSKESETAPDNHRVNENKILSAFHLMAIKLHNRIIDDYRTSYEETKKRVIACTNRMTLEQSLHLCGMDEDEFFNDIRIKDMHKMAEFNFALARWAHAQMPSTINGKGVFDRTQRSSDVDILKLFDGSEMARVLNLGVSKEMTDMSHIPNPDSILNMTFGRNNDLGLINAHQMAKISGFDVDANESFESLPQFKNCPLWPFILLEAGLTEPEGQLGPMGARWVADGIASTMLWGLHGEGVWLDWHLPQSDTADSVTTNIIKYALS